MSKIETLLKATQAFAKPPVILMFDSPYQIAVANSIWNWTDYKCQHEKGYKSRDLSHRKLPGLTDPTNQHPLEEQVKTTVSAIVRHNDKLYEDSEAGEVVGSNVGKFRAISVFQKAIEACDKHLGKENVDKGIDNLRPDLLQGDTRDMTVSRGMTGYSDKHSYSLFSGKTIDAWWVLSCKDVIFVSRPPLFVHSDGEGQLHRKDGPAVEYKDGFEVWAWRGWVLKKEYILKPSTLPYDMHTDPDFDGLYWIEDYQYFHNLAELVGYSYFFKHARKETLDEDYDRKKKHRKLVNLEWGNYHHDLHLLVLGDGRERAYLKMPTDIETCAEAVAWSFGKAVKEYQPIEET